ncbi:hypothetical protein EAH84_14085 [Sphingomonas oligophenolica]|uniref:Pyridoxamine 5'-phosphate oxidase family protein n=2 Tax=Sphingomonas oligophenolica TaxID=301154 RepID=A0A502C6W1_9SPHN|nr:hypothetical protein EAH84_14085 [Sphingomonas oligophenolica]
MIPPSIRQQFNGTDLEQKMGVAAILSTTDHDGWPHLSFLSVGEVMCDHQRVALLSWSRSHAVESMARTQRGVLFVAADDVVHEMRLEAAVVSAGLDEKTRVIVAEVNTRRENRAPYAAVGSLVDFTLDDPAAAVARWARQIAVLRPALLGQSASQL